MIISLVNLQNTRAVEHSAADIFKLYLPTRIHDSRSEGESCLCQKSSHLRSANHMQIHEKKSMHRFLNLNASM